MGLTPARSIHEDFAARQATIATGLLLFVTNVGLAAIERSLRNEVHWMPVAHAGTSALLVLVLWRHRAIAVRWSLAAFVAMVLTLLPILWVTEARGVTGGSLLPPFMARKPILLALALLTPSAPAALVLLALYFAEWLAFWHHFELWAHPTAVASGEPWLTLLHFATACLLVAFRWRNAKLEHLLNVAEQEAHMLREVAHISAAIRDRAGTPLQSLELSLAALHARHPEERATLERMGRALKTLADLRPLAGTQAEIARLRDLREAGESLEHVDVPR